MIRRLSLAIASTLAAQAAPVLTDLVITDVSPSAFRVVWHASEASEPSVEVFTDAGGTIPAATAVKESYAGIDEYSQVLLSNAGIMVVEVRGLDPGTTYHVRATATSLANAAGTAAPMTSVVTASSIAPMALAAPFTAVTNPVLRFSCLSPDGRDAADTGLLLAEVSGARSPISQAVTSDSTVYLETGNLISNTTGHTLPVTGEESLTLKFYRGLGVVETFEFFMPAGDQLATVEDPRLTAEPLVAPEIRTVPGTDGVARVFVEFPVTPGDFYRVEVSDNLGPTAWTRVGNPVRSSDTRLFWEDSGLSGTPEPPADSSRRFYRAVPFVP